MSVSTELERIQAARNKLRAKATELAIAEGTAKLDELATAFDGIVNNGSVSATVQEGDTYTIPKGYHNGSGTVSGVAGGGNYNLQSKTVTPTKQQQNVTPDGGYYGLSDVTVEAIPANYQDVSSVTAAEAEVLATKVFVDSTGKVKTGTMPNNGAVTKTLDGKTTSFPIPAGYHNGTGNVSIVPETKSATPTKSQQTISPTVGKVLSSVTVEPIPSEYADVSGVTAVADHVLVGDSFVTKEGVLTEGKMANNGAADGTIDGLTTTSKVIPAGYTSGGTVSLTNDIETALAAI